MKWKLWNLSFRLDEARMLAAPTAVRAPEDPHRLLQLLEPKRGGARKVPPFIESLLPSAPVSPFRRVPKEVAELAKPWKTRVQLERLHSVPRKTDETFQFIVVGDAEPGRFRIWRKLFNQEGVFGRQLQRIRARGVDFIVQLGDMVSRGLPEYYSDFLKGLEASGIEAPYLTVLGNHDRHFPHGRSDASVYQQVFGNPNYYFDRGPCRFVIVDTSEDGLTQARLRWLDRILKTPLRTLVFTHKPPKQLTRWTAGGLGGFGKGSKNFVQLAARHRVDRVYMGHVHGLGVTDLRGVRYVLTGGGGSPLFPSGAPGRFHHHLVVEASPHGITETVVRLDGSESPLTAA